MEDCNTWDYARGFPLQRACGGGSGVSIPWEIGKEAYDKGYAVQYPGSARQQSAERIAQRGGFSVGEMEMFLPGWSDRGPVDWSRLVCRVPHCTQCAPYRQRIRQAA